MKQMEEASTKHSDAPKTKEEQREFMNDLMVKTMMAQDEIYFANDCKFENEEFEAALIHHCAVDKEVQE